MSHHPPDIDVLAVGNALVDVLASAEEELIDELGLTKGTMALIDEPRMEVIYGAMGPGTEVSGGSAANTAVGAASLGASAHFVGRVRDDQLGHVFVHDIRATGVGYTGVPAADGPATGCCLILVTPDAQRTMNTFLGASALIGPADIDPAVVGSARVTFLEGYLFDPPDAKEAFFCAASAAHDAGREVALTLSDTFCVERHRDSFLELLDGNIDILFANEAEILALYRLDDFDEAVARVRGHVPLAALTRSGAGSVLLGEGGDPLHVDAVPVAEVLDTTGAGDLYAAGFLFGHCRDLPLATCGALGSVAAAEVISHLGPRPLADLSELAAPLLDGA